jgi:L-threonylcarbamoyladenylate synthase
MFQLKLNNNTEEILKKTLKVLKEGGVVIFPSDTVYGALVDATNAQAVNKLIKFKNRPPGKAISVFVSDLKMLESQVVVDAKNINILKKILPGPFTIVLKSKGKINKLLESEKRTLGVRIPIYPLIIELTKRFGRPITATSANLGGKPPRYSIQTLLNELPEKKKNLIDLVVDAGKLPRNKPSTVVDLTTPELKILRKGDLDFIKTKKYVTKSEKETKRIASDVIPNKQSELKKLAKRKPLVFIIEGELGVGKTVFVKGIGERFGIKNIVSPTYVIYYEYGNFYHFDLYQIEEKEEFKYLGIEKILKPGNIICFEWGEKAGEIYDLLKSKAEIINVKMRYLSENVREIVLNY